MVVVHKISQPDGDRVNQMVVADIIEDGEESSGTGSGGPYQKQIIIYLGGL